VHDALAAELDALGSHEWRARVAQEPRRGHEPQDVHERVPREHDVRPRPQDERREPRGRECAGVRRPRPSRRWRELRQPRRIGGAARARDEEGQQRDAVAEGVVHADGHGGRRLGCREVEDVELPERAGLVHGRRGQRGDVVLDGLVRVGRRGGGVQVGEDDVVVQVHRAAHPPRLRVLLQIILHLPCHEVLEASGTAERRINVAARSTNESTLPINRLIERKCVHLILATDSIPHQLFIPSTSHTSIMMNATDEVRGVQDTTGASFSSGTRKQRVFCEYNGIYFSALITITTLERGCSHLERSLHALWTNKGSLIYFSILASPSPDADSGKTIDGLLRFPTGIFPTGVLPKICPTNR
jgi:hypothetical protein